jgi:hypothetical protein
MHHAVELLAAAGDECERGVVVGRGLVPAGAAEAGAAPGQWERTALAQVGAAVLELVAALREALDAGVRGDHPRDLGAHGGGVGETHGARHLGPGSRDDLAQHEALGARLGHARPGDLRAEHDAALGGRLGDAAGDLVAGGGGEDHERVGRIVEHVGRQGQVHVDAQRDARQRRVDAARVGQHLAERAADGEQHVDAAVAAASIMAGVVSPGSLGTSKPQAALNSAARSAVMGSPPGNALA